MDNANSDKKFLKRALPEILQEVEGNQSAEQNFPSSAPSATAEESNSDEAKGESETPQQPQTAGTPVKRENDNLDLEQNLADYLRNVIELRDRYANRLFALLLLEITVMFALVFLSGFKLIDLEQWLVVIVVETIMVKTFLTIQIIVKNLFPNKGLLELIVQHKSTPK